MMQFEQLPHMVAVAERGGIEKISKVHKQKLLISKVNLANAAKMTDDVKREETLTKIIERSKALEERVRAGEFDIEGSEPKEKAEPKDAPVEEPKKEEPKSLHYNTPEWKERAAKVRDLQEQLGRRAKVQRAWSYDKLGTLIDDLEAQVAEVKSAPVEQEKPQEEPVVEERKEEPKTPEKSQDELLSEMARKAQMSAKPNPKSVLKDEDDDEEEEEETEEVEEVIDEVEVVDDGNDDLPDSASLHDVICHGLMRAAREAGKVRKDGSFLVPASVLRRAGYPKALGVKIYRGDYYEIRPIHALDKRYIVRPV